MFNHSRAIFYESSKFPFLSLSRSSWQQQLTKFDIEQLLQCVLGSCRSQCSSQLIHLNLFEIGQHCLYIVNLSNSNVQSVGSGNITQQGQNTVFMICENDITLVARLLIPILYTHSILYTYRRIKFTNDVISNTHFSSSELEINNTINTQLANIGNTSST